MKAFRIVRSAFRVVKSAPQICRRARALRRNARIFAAHGMAYGNITMRCDWAEKYSLLPSDIPRNHRRTLLGHGKAPRDKRDAFRVVQSAPQICRRARALRRDSFFRCTQDGPRKRCNTRIGSSPRGYRHTILGHGKSAPHTRDAFPIICVTSRRTPRRPPRSPALWRSRRENARARTARAAF